VEQGEILYIVGGNGSGKTTLAMLLLGLYRPEQGALLLNGVEVDDAALEAYRSHFSAVFADFHLFEEILGTDRADLSRRAEHYVHALGMRHKVKVTDGRFSTLDLSSGQRKRLALVASYIEDRPVYLFDEWAADQDPRFKRIFYTELLPELKARGKTVIVITHDDAYFAHADRIIKLEDGQLQALHAETPDLGAMRHTG
jgi:putative ATP-binding cassette transporter